MKPALTQPWGPVDLPEHLSWAFGGRWNPCGPPGVLENIIPSCFCPFHSCLLTCVRLRDEQVADLLPISSQALLKFTFTENYM